MERKKMRRKPKMLIKETFHKSKQYFYKTLRNLNFCKFSKEYQKLPDLIYSDFDNISYKSFSEKWESNHVKKQKDVIFITPKEQIKGGDEQCCKISPFINVANYKDGFNFKGSKEEKKRESNSLLAASTSSLPQKMKELEMMGMDDLDHDLDIEEVLAYYSRLKCPEYVEMVDNFFMDMYSEFSLLKPSTNTWMRKVGSTSVHSSIRSLGPIKI